MFYNIVAILAVPVGCVALYALHCGALWLEAKGQLYYWHKKPQSGVDAALMPLQEALQPQIRHVVQVAEQAQARPSDAAGDPPVRD